MNGLLQDARFALRTIAKSPAFTAVVVATLALGIGVTSAIFSLVNTLFWKPLPVRDAARLVHVTQSRSDGERYAPLSYPDYLYYRDHVRTLSPLAAHYSSAPIHLVAGGGPSEEINGSVVTASYFPLLSASPLLGRVFENREDEVPGRDPVAVVGYELWQRRLGADASILGRSIQLNGTLFRVVGVMPRGFEGAVSGGLATDVWIPSAMFLVGYRYCDPFQRDCNIVRLLGRLPPSRSLAEAQAEMGALARQLQTAYPATNGGRGVTVLSARGVAPPERESSGRVAALLLAVTGLVLLIACANVAGLLLARATARRKEIAVRLALGASRARLVRQLLVESLLLCALGGALGVFVAFWTTDLLQTFYAVNSEGQRAYFPAGLDPLVVAFTAGLSLLSGIAFGLFPAIRTSRTALAPALQSDGRSGSPRRSRLREGLVVAQAAASVILIAGAGLLVRSLRNVFSGPGFEPSHVLILRLRPALIAETPGKALAFQREVLRRLDETPGVVAASPARFPPQWNNLMAVRLPEQDAPRPGEGFRAAYNLVGPRYFETLGIALREGRDFEQADRKGAPCVAIANQTLARRLWPNGGALGGVLVADEQQCRIVGIVRDAQYRSESQPPVPFLYLDFWQQVDTDTAPVDARMHVRVAGDPRAALPAIRRLIGSVHPDVPISEDRPLAESLDYSFRPVRVATAMLVCFGALALLLAAIGLYGALAFAVGQRTREIGIRVALGAEPGRVFRAVVGQGALLALAGTGLGLLALWPLTRLLEGVLYGVSRHDPVALLTAPGVLAAVSVLASIVPARRAMRVDPIVALRSE